MAFTPAALNGSASGQVSIGELGHAHQRQELMHREGRPRVASQTFRGGCLVAAARVRGAVGDRAYDGAHSDTANRPDRRGSLTRYCVPADTAPEIR
jgi:hypothetical protein